MSFRLNLSDEEFEQVMIEIDKHLVSEQVKTPARQIRGWMLFCEKQQLEGISFTDPVSKKAMDWFKTRYGDRLNLDFGLGHSVELIRGDLLCSRCVVFFGRLHVICHAGWMGKLPKGTAVNRPALVNVLDLVDGVTPPFAGSLTPEEKQCLLRGFAMSQLHLSRIADLGKQAFIAEARADLRESVEHMFRHEAQFGLSKWASLQAAEKFLKAYIRQQGTEPRQIHILKKLAETAATLGLRPILPSVLAAAECSPGARYDGNSVARAEAIESYRAAVEIAGHVTVQLKTDSTWRTEIDGEGFLTFEGSEERVPMFALQRNVVKSPLDQDAGASSGDTKNRRPVTSV